MNKIDLIVRLLEKNVLPMLNKSRDLTVQEYMKLKHESIKAIENAVTRNDS